MTVQTLTLGKRKFVVVPETDFRRLQERAADMAAKDEDRRDAAILRRRLDEMRRRGEKPTPYVQFRKQLGLE